MGGKRTLQSLSRVMSIQLNFRLSTLASLLLCSCASVSGRDRIVVEYGCGDVVVVGRANTVSYTDTSGPNDLLGHGVFQMDITVREVLRGRVEKDTVRAAREAHGQLRDDVDFIFVLQPKGNDFGVMEAHLASSRPALAPRCG